MIALLWSRSRSQKRFRIPVNVHLNNIFSAAESSVTKHGLNYHTKDWFAVFKFRVIVVYSYDQNMTNFFMLKIILNRLKPQAEKIITEEQAGFRAGRSTTEQIFNLRILLRNISSTSKTSAMSS